MREGLAMEGMGVLKVDHVDFVIGCDGKCVGILWMPLDSSDSFLVVRGRDAKQNASSERDNGLDWMR